MRPDLSALDDLRAVAWLYRQAQLENGPTRGHYVGIDTTLALIRQRHPEMDERMASAHAVALLREAWRLSGQWVYGGVYEGEQHLPV